MTSNIVLPKNFDCNNLGFDDLKLNSNGGKVVYLKYEGQQRLTMQTPKLTTPFGISEFKDDKTGTVKYSIDASFKGMNEDAKIQTFYDKMTEIDSTIVDLAVENSKEWFGKKMKKEIVEELYRPLIKVSKDPEKYAPTMKFKIQSNSKDELMIEAFDNNREPVDILETLKSGSKVRGIIECSSIWFVNKQFGVTWRAVQLEVTKSDKISGFSFVTEDDDVEDEYEDDDNNEDEL